jgi:hypothetical protein
MIYFDEVNHLYYVDGKPVPSVTTIISSVCGSGYDTIPVDVLAKASYRGSCVHSATEIVDEGEDPSEYIQSVKTHSESVFGSIVDIEPFVSAYQKAKLPKWSVVEHRFYCGGELPYAGTIDRATASEVWDIKTQSLKDEKKWQLQLSAYAEAVNMDSISVIWLKKDWTSKIVPLKTKFEDWNAVLRVFYLVHYENWLKSTKEKLKQTEII